MRALVTGGRGFIGSHLVERLRNYSIETNVVDRQSERDRMPLCDITNAVALDARIATFRPDVVFHLAAQASVRTSIADPVYDAQQNIIGTLNVLASCKHHGCNRIVFASSGGCVYGESPADGASVETDMPSPQAPYGVAKLACEHYIRISGIHHVILRLGNIYGYGQDPRNDFGAAAIFIDRVLSGRKPVVFGDGRNERDYVHISDVVEAMLKALDGETGVYNIGTGKATATLDILADILSLLRQDDVEPTFAPLPLGEVQRSCLDAAKAAREFGWRPRVALMDGIADTIGQMERSYAVQRA